MNIQTVTIIGANGTMGKNVAGIFASFGNAKVYMVCRNMKDAEHAKIEAAETVKANTIIDNLIAETYDNIEFCINQSDLIFESLSENLKIKEEMYCRISKYIKKGTILATGTSGLSINKLSKSYNKELRENFLGIHMYNPPYSMNLCEVIPSEMTNTSLLKEVKSYLSKVLYRDVVEVKDQPAFMGNRIGFQFINEVLQYSVLFKDQGGIDYMDAILSKFTGRHLPPLVTSDFVGLDVHKAIVDNIYQNTFDYANETFKLPIFVEKLISENNLGRKTGSGLYRKIVTKNNTKVLQVYDISTNKYRNTIKYNFDFAANMQRYLKESNYKEAFTCLLDDKSQEARICIQFIIKYVIYSLVTTKLIGEDMTSADHVMAEGFNWVPPLAVIDAFGGVTKFKHIVLNKMPTDYLTLIDVEEIFNNIPVSSYDYRPFFMAN